MYKLFQLLTIGVLLQSCISENSCPNTIEKDTEQINYNAPFYTHRLPSDLHPRVSKLYDSTLIEAYFPFIILKDSTYMIAAEIQKDTMLDSYAMIFERYGYSGNGYNWENYITYMLSGKDSEILRHIQLDPEGGGFYAFADSEKNQRKFAALVSVFFKDTATFASQLSKIDSARIEN